MYNNDSLSFSSQFFQVGLDTVQKRFHWLKPGIENGEFLAGLLWKYFNNELGHTTDFLFFFSSNN